MAVADAEKPGWLEGLRVYLDRRVLAVLLLGFTSGLPILLVLSTLSAWLTEAGVDMGTIGLFGFVFAPYVFKFAWSPLVDRLPLPPFTTLFGRRRGWMLFAQIGLIVSIWGLGRTDPVTDLWWTAFAAVLVAFFSATQDIAIDAFRIESLPQEKLGAGAGVVVLGYRIAMFTASAGALYLAAEVGWSTAYAVMALLVLVGVGTVLAVKEPKGSTTRLIDDDLLDEERNLREVPADRLAALRGLSGVLLTVLVWLVVLEPLSFLFGLLGPYNAGWAGSWGIGHTFGLALVLAGNVAIMGLGLRVAYRMWRLDPSTGPDLKTYALLALGWAVFKIVWYVLSAAPPYFGEVYGWALLALIGLAVNGVLALFGAGPIVLDAASSVPWVMILSFWIEFFVLVAVYGVPYFSLRAIATFGRVPIKGEHKVHLWMRRAVIEPFHDFFERHGLKAALTILALISLFKASDAVLTLMANPFYLETGFTLKQIAIVSKTFGPWMSVVGGILGGTLTYRLGLMRSLAVAAVAMGVSNLMYALMAVIGDSMAFFYLLIIVENAAGGVGSAVLVAYLSALCNVHYTAVQYALLTSFMQLFAKFVVIPASGFYAEGVGWVWFFTTSALMSLPALLLVYAIARQGLAAPVPTGAADGHAA